MTAPMHERLRTLMATVMTASHQVNMGEGYDAITTLRIAGAQLGAIRATLNVIHDQGQRKTKPAKRK